MARSVWIWRRPTRIDVGTNSSLGNATYVGNYAIDQYLDFATTLDDPELTIPNGTDVLFVVTGHFAFNQIGGIDAPLVAMEMRLAFGAQGTNQFSLVSAGDAAMQINNTCHSFGFLARDVDYQAASPCKVIGRLKQNAASAANIGGFWSVDDLTILAFDLGVFSTHHIAENFASLAGNNMFTGPVAVQSLAVPHFGTNRDWLAFYRTTVIPGDPLATYWCEGLFDSSLGNEDFGRLGSRARGPGGDNTVNVDSFVRMGAFTEPGSGSARIIGTSEGPPFSKYVGSTIALLDRSQFNQTGLRIRLGDGSGFPFRVPSYYELSASARVQLPSIEIPDGSDVREYVAFADGTCQDGAGAQVVTHNGAGISLGGGLIGEISVRSDFGTITGTSGRSSYVPNYSGGRTPLVDGVNLVESWGVKEGFTGFRPDAEHLVLFGCLADQALITGVTPTLAGPKVAISVSGEAPALGALNIPPILPSALIDVAYQGAGSRFFETDGGYVRSTPLFTIIRTRVVLDWPVLTAPEVEQLQAFFNAQGNAAFKLTLPNETTERAFTVISGKLEARSVGHHGVRSEDLGPFVEDDRRAYRARVQAVELVRLL